MTEGFQQVMAKATTEQKDVIENASPSAAIISCPGSGKTFTTALRMAHRLNNWQSRCSGIALLSYTNIAISSFEKQFKDIGYLSLPKMPHFVGTLDGFITRFLVANFGHLVMGCSRAPTLIVGSESFLENEQLKVWFQGNPRDFPQNIGEMSVSINAQNQAFLWYSDRKKGIQILPKQPFNLDALTMLGKWGFYTHEHGRYWGAKVMEKMPKLCEILARRFPEIIVDEAQDTNPWQQRILSQLEQAGSKLMLVGDPDQAIFEFGMGNAAHLNQHKTQQGVDDKKLSKNLRSNQTIVAAAKVFGTATDMSSDILCADAWQGAYVIGYGADAECSVAEKFEQHIENCGLSGEMCAVVARSRDMVKKLRGDNSAYKDTPTHRFAKAALQRDFHGNPREAFEICKSIILQLCDATQKWKEIERDSNADTLRKEFRKKLWGFVRDNQNGLPCSSLKAKSEWHPKLKTALQALCQDLSTFDGFTYPQTLGNNITTRDLADSPVTNAATSAMIQSAMRVDTVHGVKGDTFEALLYLMTEKHLAPLIKRLDGKDADLELMKIGYVAMTRPRQLLWLAIPEASLQKHQQALVNAGFKLVAVTDEVRDAA